MKFKIFHEMVYGFACARARGWNVAMPHQHKKRLPYLGILVRFGAKETLSVNHLNGLLSTSSEATEITKISTGVNKATTNGVGIASDGSNDDAAGVLGLLHVIEEEVDEEEMSEVVDAHGHLEAIVGPSRIGILGLVNGGVADKVVEGTGRLEGLEVLDEITDGLEISKLELHDGVGTVGETILLGDCMKEERT